MPNRLSQLFNANRKNPRAISGGSPSFAAISGEQPYLQTGDGLPNEPTMALVVADTPYYWDTNKNAMIMTGDMLYTGDKRVILGEDPTHRWVQVMMNAQMRAWAPRANFNFRGAPPVVG